MSTENKKLLRILNKDIKQRRVVQQRGDATFELDGDIKGQFITINQEIIQMEGLLATVLKNSNSFKLNQRQIQEYRMMFDQVASERNRNKQEYEKMFIQKSSNRQVNQARENYKKFEEDYKPQTLNKQQLLALKQVQEQRQDEHIEDLLGVVRNIKTGNKAIGQQLDQQKPMLEELQYGMNDNMEGMSKTKKNMMKLLDSSGYTCLIIVIIIEIIAVICNLIFWKK